MNAKRLSLPVIAGHVVECFDATIYGFYAVVLAPFFFPPSQSQLLMSFGAFSAGFIVRPLGALFFGFLGDKFGRKKPLTAAMALVGVPTLIIGILPTYDTIGLWATSILFICRGMQGFFYGAEFAGVSVYTYESYAETNRLGKNMGIVMASGSLGAVFATAAGALFSMDMMPKEAWRIPFILGGLAAFGVFFWRKHMEETPAFQKAKIEKRLKPLPLRSLLNYGREMLSAIIIISTNTVALYVITVFSNSFLLECGYTASQSMLINMMTLVMFSVLVAVFGRLADKIGFKKQVIAGCIWTCVVSIPCFHLLFLSQSFAVVVFVILLIAIGGSLVAASVMPYVSSFFPTHCRFSALALTSTLGYAIISGNTPAIAAYLQEALQWKLAPALWIMLTSFAALVSIVWVERNRQLRNNESKALDLEIKLERKA